MFEHALNPILFELGPLQIRWYGVMWALSFLLVYWYVRKSAREQLIKLTDDDVDWLMVWMTVATLLGARLFEVLVWEPGYYFSNLAEIPAIWHGGLSFHGGLLGGLLGVYLFARRRAVPYLNLLDVIVVPVAFGQALGRLGNFINGELWGRVTTVPWAVQFPGAEGYRHPSQLYEAAYDIVIFGILWMFRGKKLRHGTLFALFLVLYAAFRFVTEYFREPTSYVGSFTLGQALNIPMFLAGIVILFWLRRKH